MMTPQQNWKALLGIAVATIATQIPAAATPWVTAYYTTWTVGSPAPANIDMRPITHLLFFALAPNADGTLTDTDGGITANEIGRAHV